MSLWAKADLAVLCDREDRNQAGHEWFSEDWGGKEGFNPTTTTVCCIQWLLCELQLSKKEATQSKSLFLNNECHITDKNNFYCHALWAN